MIRAFSYKKFGYFCLDNNSASFHEDKQFSEFIKIFFVKAGGNITIDFQKYGSENDALFFVSPSQICFLSNNNSINGHLIFYNRDFYCVEIHDKEVSCDGILYNNVYETPRIILTEKQSKDIQTIFTDIQFEVQNEDIANEEMIRILLKQIIIKATRIWKVDNEINTMTKNKEVEFIRKFSQLVELHFKQLHTVADYANLLFVTPKNLNKKITQFTNQSPNQIIKDRIILEAKRLLAHTELNSKEIAYKLGYEDEAYFNRFFSNQTGLSPIQFRKQYHNSEGKNVQF